MAMKPIEITVSQPGSPSPDEDEPTFPPYAGPAFFSYGFRPFFLCAALFAALAVPVWVLIVAGVIGSDFLYPPREWHVHEMLFGFLPAVITGFLLTAVPNWTNRPPVRGALLMALMGLWLGGRLLQVAPGPVPLVAAVVDGAFLVALAAIVWRELSAAGRWSQAPVGVLISLYAVANMVFHVMALRGSATDVPERMALSLDMVLLTLIGGRLAPAFTRECLVHARRAERPAAFSRFDGLSLALVVLAVLAWIAQPESPVAGGLLAAAGAVNFVRLSRWYGWVAWREPLVLMLHLGYGWLSLSMLAIGGAVLGVGLPAANAAHVLTTGAVGAMTLAVMTRASLGHTGRPKYADLPTIAMYVLVNLGGVLRVLAPGSDAPTTLTHTVLGLSALCWSGAYLLFAVVYGPYLFRRALDE